MVDAAEKVLIDGFYSDVGASFPQMRRKDQCRAR
jgi:hypothetical protein